MKNKLIDLNNHLFAQIERLGDEGLTLDGIKKECQRTEAITMKGIDWDQVRVWKRKEE